MSSSDEFARALVPTFLRPINAVFARWEEHLSEFGRNQGFEGWWEELAEARRHLDLLVTGAVALQNQEDPGEVTRLKERLATANGLLKGYGAQITEAAARHRAELVQVRSEFELTHRERAELGKLRKELEKSAGRLAQARGTIAKYEANKAAGKRRDVEIDLVATCLVRALAHLDGVEVVPENNTRLQAHQIKVVLGEAVVRGFPWLTKS